LGFSSTRLINLIMKPNSELDLKELSFGVPIQAVLRIKPNLGHFPEDLKLNGDRIGILDVNNRIREEYECTNIFPGNESALQVYNTVLIPYLRASLEGVNISILAFGTSGSGKTYTIQGDHSSPGIINFFIQAIFEGLDEKKKMLTEGRKFDKTFTYRVKMRYLEVVNEEVRDLLKTASSNFNEGEIEVIPDEWEGMTVKGSTWIPCASSSHLVELLNMGKQNRTTANGSFGPLHEQSTSILAVEIFQITSNQSTLETTVLASRVYFVDLPCHDKLLDLNARIREGPYSQSIFALAKVIQGLSRGDQYTSYDDSLVTQLMKDMIGGNSLTVGVFCLQNGDPVGSSLVLSHMRMIRTIMNFPVVNDSRLIGLLRKYRLDIIELLHRISQSGTGSIDVMRQKIQELEKIIGVYNIEKLRVSDEKGALSENIRGLKESYNKLVKDKADLQKQLIETEEEKLRASKEVIELQIRIAELEENHADNKYSVSTRLIQAEKEIKLAQKREEKSMIAVHEAQEKMERALKDKTEIEMEFLALKKNFLEQGKKLNEERTQNERLTAELVNLVNANSVLANDTDYLSKLKTNLSGEQKNSASENLRLRGQVQSLQDDLMNASVEIEQLKVELTRYDLNQQRMHIEFDNRKLELERGYLQMAHKRDQDTNSKVQNTETVSKRIKNQDELLKSELTVVNRQLKAAERKIKELDDHLTEYKSHENEIGKENESLQGQLSELRAAYRAALGKNLGEGYASNTREELVRSYNARENDLQRQVNGLIAHKSSLIKTIRGLRSYARSLKHLAEDWAPSDHPLPQLLTMPPALLMEDDDLALDTKAQLTELERLRKRNAHLEQEIKAVQAQLLSYSEGTLKAPSKQNQERLFNEIEYLRANTPGSASNLESLRKERNDLKEENRRLLQDLRKSSGDPSKAQEIEKLKRIISDYEQGKPGVAGGAGSSRGLQQRLNYLEEILKKLEKERSELSVRATMAEEQLKNMQEHMDSSVQNYQRKILELSRRLGK